MPTTQIVFIRPSLRYRQRSEVIASHQLDVRHAIRGRLHLEEKAVAISNAGDEVEPCIEAGVAEVEAFVRVVTDRFETPMAEAEARPRADVRAPARTARRTGEGVEHVEVD